MKKPDDSSLFVTRSEYVRLTEIEWIVNHLLQPELDHDATRLLDICLAASRDRKKQFALDYMHQLAKVKMLTEKHEPTKTLLLLLIVRQIEANEFDERDLGAGSVPSSELDMDVWGDLLDDGDTDWNE